MSGVDVTTGLRERAQGVDCWGLKVAVPYSWARAVVEDFELSQVPNAPLWMVGAANVDGRIVAVVDLSAWVWPGQPEADLRDHRLLLGGDGADSLALSFGGLPSLLVTSPEPVLTEPALQGHVCGHARGDGLQARWPLLDMAGLTRAWLAELHNKTA